MKLGKEALLSACFFFISSVYAGTGAGLSNRPQHPRRVLNTTTNASEPSLLRPSSGPATTILSSSTTVASDSVSLSLPSQQDPSSKPTHSWPSGSSTLSTSPRSRSKGSSSFSALSVLSSPSKPLASTTRMSPDAHGTTNNGTNIMVPSEAKNTHAFNRSITGTGAQSRPTVRTRVKAQTTVTMECPLHGEECYILGGPKLANESVSTSTITKECTTFSDDLEPMTIYSVIHTKTVTYYGNRTDYTPPYSTMKTPVYCEESPEEIEPTATDGFLPHATQVSSKATTDDFRSLAPFARPKITFITTDKNPSVVFPSEPPPNYSATWSDPYPNPIVHKSVLPQGASGGQGLQGSHSGLGQTPERDNQPRPTFSVTARGDEVIINNKTFSLLKPDQTTTVSVDRGTFTVNPTAIIGEGVTVVKPAPAPTKFGVPSPTEGSVGGLDVSLSGSQVAIGGVTMTMPPYGTTTNIQGQSVTISANQIVVGTSSFKFDTLQAPPESDVVVVGGEMLTVAGKSVVVVHSKTITYGPDTPTTTEVIQGDTVTIGPSGVFVHGLALGGSQANKSETKYEILGGATITQIAPSVAIINGKTFTVGPGSHVTTTAIAGQDFTLGPMGVVVSTMTLSYPFGSSVVTTIAPTGTWLTTLPEETSPPKDDDSMGPSLRPSLPCAGVALCIAIGVSVFA